MKVFVIHVSRPSGARSSRADCRPRHSAERQAGVDVVRGRFDDLGRALRALGDLRLDRDPNAFEAEVRRVIDEVYVEPSVGRRHVHCDAWSAHVDEMRVQP